MQEACSFSSHYLHTLCISKKKRGKKGEDQKRLGRVGNYPGTDQGSGVCYLLCSSLL